MKLAAWSLGIACLALIWGMMSVQRLDLAFTSHMVFHMGIVAIAAPLLAYGLSGTRLDPTVQFPGFNPVVASLVELIVVWVWHMPRMRDWADLWAGGRVVEQISFLIGGLLLWFSCLRAPAGHAGLGRLAGTLGLLLTSMHMTLLGVLLALAPRSFYGQVDVSCFGIVLSAEQDQQVGGVVMLVIGASVYLAGGVALMSKVLSQPSRTPAGAKT